MIPARARITGPPETPPIRRPLAACVFSHCSVALSRKAVGLPPAQTSSRSSFSASPARAVQGTVAPQEALTVSGPGEMCTQR